MSLLLSTFIAFLLLPALRLYADDTVALKDRLHKADAGSALDAPGMKPWHLVLSFQLSEANGKPGETGTIEEWWESPKFYKVVYTSPSYTNIEILNEHGFYKAKPDSYTPLLLQQLQSGVVHPFISSGEIDQFYPQIQKRDAGSIPLDCIHVFQSAQGSNYPPAMAGASFCLARDTTSLLASIYFNELVITPSEEGSFQQKRVSMDQSIKLSGALMAKSHMETLEIWAPSPEMFVPSADMTKTTKVVAMHMNLGANETISKTPPIYPLAAKQKHISGTVAMRAIIGKDGHVKNLMVISSPDSDLTDAAEKSVRQWIYKPYIVDVLSGEAAEIDTVIRVNFSFSH